MADYGRDKGLFIPTTQVWDTSEINEAQGVSEDLKELLVRMYQNLNNMAMAVNKKDTGIYHTDEFVCGQTFFPNPAYDSSTATTPALRQVYRKVVSFGALLNNANKAVAHGITITADIMFTRIYGVSYNPAGLTWLPLPYATSAVPGPVSLFIGGVGGAFINITTDMDRTAFTQTFVVLEYIKT